MNDPKVAEDDKKAAREWLEKYRRENPWTDDSAPFPLPTDGYVAGRASMRTAPGPDNRRTKCPRCSADCTFDGCAHCGTGRWRQSAKGPTAPDPELPEGWEWVDRWAPRTEAVERADPALGSVSVGPAGEGRAEVWVCADSASVAVVLAVLRKAGHLPRETDVTGELRIEVDRLKAHVKRLEASRRRQVQRRRG